MDSHQQLRQWLAEVKVIVARMEAELDKHDEDTGRNRAETEAKRRRRGMHSMAIIPAAVGTLATAAKQQSPVASAAVALTASAIIGAMVVTHPGGGVTRDTESGVIAGQRPPATAMEPRPPRSLTRPKEPAPVSIRPVRKKPAPQPPPKVQTVDLKPVRAPTRAVTRNTAPMSAMRATADRPACAADLRLVKIARVRLCR